MGRDYDPPPITPYISFFRSCSEGERVSEQPSSGRAIVTETAQKRKTRRDDDATRSSSARADVAMHVFAALTGRHLEC